ncbi:MULTISPECIES: hypothetical protein [Methylorubrum]|uniref:DUF3618 domain-containing protein n=1 Tax=Methylorubrum suomiense TaxID=144191 RepID=A0ABQ4UP19_9HYPH|nr:MULTISPECIES: hypothetical protein [Methylobacteriaceae]GJE73992.1 hypothetical protein BGCPKDLD_0559 [Methylorubrum suomiense]
MTASASPDPVGGADPAARQADLKDLRHDVEDTAHVAVERGRGLAAAARQQALDYVDQRKGEAARSVGDLAKSVRDSGQTFEDRPNIRAFFDSAADGLDDLAGSIERRGLDDFYAEAEAFARRSPVTTAVATFAAGFLLARFVKASGQTERSDRYDDGYRA